MSPGVLSEIWPIVGATITGAIASGGASIIAMRSSMSWIIRDLESQRARVRDLERRLDDTRDLVMRASQGTQLTAQDMSRPPQ